VDGLLSDEAIEALAAGLVDDSITAVALFGSYARGDATRSSDIDIVRFASILPPLERDRYTLRQHGDYLLSISTTTIEEKRREMTQPDTAIFAVPGIRQACALIDPTGAFADLQEAARAFEWSPLQSAANEFASELLLGDAEEAHKVMGALLLGDEHTIVYGATILFMAMTKALAVQRGILMTSENSYFQQVQQAAGMDSAWTRAHRLAAGLDYGAPDRPPAVVRGLAALQLYQETVTLLRTILCPEHREVIEATVQAITSLLKEM
jgi:hypothetical protein